MISSIKANELEGFVDGSHVYPPKCFTSPRPNQTTITTLNPEYLIWKKHDHILELFLSSLSEGVLGTVWIVLPHVRYGQLLPINLVQEQVRILHLRTQIQTTKNGSLAIHDYHFRMKSILNALRAVGNNMSDEDFIMCVLEG